MDQLPPPTLDSELTTGLYSDEEKAEILQRIEAAAGADRLTVDAEVFRPRKRGILFPVMVNVAAVVLIVGAWFAADSYFQTRQEGLKLKTDRLFSAESKLLAKVLEDAKAQMAAANAEIGKIQGDLQKAAADKANLQKSFEDRVAARDKALRKELSDSLAAEKARLQAAGLGADEVAKKLKEFEDQKNAEFNSRLDDYKKQAQSEIDQRAQALTALQAKLQATVNEQEKLRQDIEKQTKEREGALQSQVTTQAADLEALKKDRDEQTLFFRQADASMAAVRTAFASGDWTKAQTAAASLRQVLTKASASASETVRARAAAQAAWADALDSAVAALDSSASKAESAAQVEAIRAQAKKEAAVAAAQVAEAQQALTASEARWKQAEATADSLRQDIDAMVGRLDSATTDTFEARIDVQYLTAQVDELQRTVAELTPWREQAQTLQKLFTASYPTAQERFTTTFGSPAGKQLFPGFDPAWAEVSQASHDTSNTDATRKKALDDVLAFTTYLQGKSASPVEARDAAEKLARTDPAYKNVVDSIQALAASGGTEAGVKTAQTQLYGAVAAVSGTKVVLEPLTKVRPQVGQTIELRRALGKKETVLGRGAVLTATAQKVEIDWTGNQPPLSGDAAYLVLP